jgi:hypothetical protein
MKFKYKKDQTRFNDLPKILKEIAQDIDDWCDEMSIDWTITATWTTKEEDEKDNRISLTHRNKRAIDFVPIGWSDFDIKEFTAYYTQKYGHHGAFSKADGKQRLIIYHENNNKKGSKKHFHLQISHDSAKIT